MPQHACILPTGILGLSIILQIVLCIVSKEMLILQNVIYTLQRSDPERAGCRENPEAL
jgi:hypothetical protein